MKRSINLAPHGLHFPKEFAGTSGFRWTGRGAAIIRFMNSNQTLPAIVAKSDAGYGASWVEPERSLAMDRPADDGRQPFLVRVLLTVDTEIWPARADSWPHIPLPATEACERELRAYLLGTGDKPSWGLPYQLEMLSRYGLQATFFVDPLFSFALGLEPLREVVARISALGHSIGLHLHPEWLTDPRCRELPRFEGPFLARYAAADQRHLIDRGWARLVEAGASPVRAFRSGNWSADVSTLAILSDAGFRIDSSLNACYPDSMPSLSGRETILGPVDVGGILEVPVTRFDDGVSRHGRSLSLVGTSSAEMEFVLNECHRSRQPFATIVLHNNEFARTERMASGRHATRRRLVARRFERLCEFLRANRARFSTVPIMDTLEASIPSARVPAGMPVSSLHRTAGRWLGQLVSRWY